jgi:manganese efflux pump family protein
MIETLLIAVSLSMDAFAVSISSAACTKGLRRYHMVRAAFAFGLFQFLMPLAGWFLGATFSGLIASFDHWIAFALLAFVGGKMLVEVIKEWKENPGAVVSCPSGDEEKKRDITSKRIVFALAIATSIDALAVGMSFAVMGQNALQPSIIIGVVTFIICLFGFFFGKRLGGLFGRYAQLAGGIVLVGIGARILISHIIGKI